MIDDLAKLTPDLDALGWDDELEEWSKQAISVDSQLARGRIARVSRGFSLVFTGGDAVLAASGSMRSKSDLVPATGDYVIVADDPEDGPSLAATAPRRSALTRRAAGQSPEPQVLASNIDDVFVMQASTPTRTSAASNVSWSSPGERRGAHRGADQVRSGR